MSDALKHFTDEGFDKDVLQSDRPVLVDFWASWCGPCRVLGPVIEEIAEEYAGKVVIGKLNTEDNPETPSKFGIMAIPTLIIFKDGKEIQRLTGIKPKEVITEAIEQARR